MKAQSPILLTAAKADRTQEVPPCKYMAAGILSRRLCYRKGRCTGCPTEEMALVRSETA